MVGVKCYLCISLTSELYGSVCTHLETPCEDQESVSVRLDEPRSRSPPVWLRERAAVPQEALGAGEAMGLTLALPRLSTLPHCFSIFVALPSSSASEAKLTS